ncbi:MAG: YbhB/YbcL family Raf kinase inhibitor-like protein [archaeon]
MQIKSVFKEGDDIPEKYTADGENVNPPLEISEIPKGCKSLILIVDDPDANRVVGYTWIHWIRFNIPVDEGVKEFKIKENSEPGVGGMNTYKSGKYGGPNPPAGSGTHRYFFKIYALDSELDLDESVDKEAVEDAMEEHVLDEAELIGVYRRG